jgi:hypothetical protein
MKKVYKSLMFGTMIASAIQVQAVEKVSLTLYDLTADKLSVPLTDSYGNVIKFELNTSGLVTGAFFNFYNDVSTPLECAIAGESAENGFIPPAGGNYTCFAIKGGSATGGTAALQFPKDPYFINKFTNSDPDAKNTKKHQKGKAVGGSQELLWGFNNDADAPITDTWYVPDPFNDYPLEFLTGACNAVNLKKSVPAEAQAVAFVLGTGNRISLAGLGLGSIDNTIRISAIRFYVEDVVDGVENVEAATAAKTPVKSAYYDLTGKIVSPDAKGFIIRKTIYSDGSVNNEKTYNR